MSLGCKRLAALTVVVLSESRLATHSTNHSLHLPKCCSVVPTRRVSIAELRTLPCVPPLTSSHNRHCAKCLGLSIDQWSLTRVMHAPHHINTFGQFSAAK